MAWPPTGAVPRGRVDYQAAVGIRCHDRPSTFCFTSVVGLVPSDFITTRLPGPPETPAMYAILRPPGDHVGDRFVWPGGPLVSCFGLEPSTSMSQMSD